MHTCSFDPFSVVLKALEILQGKNPREMDRDLAASAMAICG